MSVLALLLLAIATPRAAVASDATDLYYPDDGPVRALVDADFDALVAECAGKSVGHVGVYVCGPAAMSDAAENAAVANKCLVHRETFEF